MFFSEKRILDDSQRISEFSSSPFWLFSGGLFFHYTKIAFRNIRKYKNQTLISVMGLAVGFTCFALSMIWIRYEMSFDNFHKNAKHKYVIYKPRLGASAEFIRATPIPMANYLKEAFPEITNAASIVNNHGFTGNKITIEGIEFSVRIIEADSSFLRMFDVKILEGSKAFLIPGSNKIAVTMEKSRQLFGNENPIGKTVVNNWGSVFTVCAVITEMRKPSNYLYDFITPFSDIVDPFDDYNISSHQNWNFANANTIIELSPRTNIKAFQKKLYEHVINTANNKMFIRPLTQMRYTDSFVERDVKFQYVLIFALSGLLVILCALFNYFISFTSRLLIRQKELALHWVYGASWRSQLMMLSVEFLLTVSFAAVAGLMLTQLFYKRFLALSHIQMDLSGIIRETFLYLSGIILFSLLAFWMILSILRQQRLFQTIRLSYKKSLSKILMVVQLITSIGFAFCTIIIIKQIDFLRHSGELGFSFKNQGSIVISRNNGEIFENYLKQMPEITEIVNTEGRMRNLISRNGGRTGYRINSWDGKPADVEYISLEKMYVSPEYIDFYDFRLLKGSLLTKADSESLVLINESAARALGWYDPVGKQFDDKYTVKGVIKDIYNRAPTIQQLRPAFYTKETARGSIIATSILFKYNEGAWKSLKKKIEQLIKDDEYNNKIIYNSEEEYNTFLKSENALIRLLSFVSFICVLICISGFVSLILLSCEERRKEIAIRKINGATVGDILTIFAKEYFFLLFVGAAIAFTAGYFIMQRWLENYVIQTNIPAWIYLSIIFVFALVIVFCVGWQVYKSSVENPAEVIKK